MSQKNKQAHCHRTYYRDDIQGHQIKHFSCKVENSILRLFLDLVNKAKVQTDERYHMQGIIFLGIPDRCRCTLSILLSIFQSLNYYSSHKSTWRFFLLHLNLSNRLMNIQEKEKNIHE